MYDGKTGEAGRWDQRSPLFASMVYIRSLFCENMGLLSLFHRSEASKRIGCNIYSKVAKSGCLQNCQRHSHSWDVDLEEVPEFLGSPVMAVLLLETSNRASFASLIWEGSASAPCDLHLATEVNMNMNHTLFVVVPILPLLTIPGWND